MLLPDGHDVLPTDLAEVIGVRYPFDEASKPGLAHNRLISIFDSACAQIVDKIEEVMNRSSEPQQQPGAGAVTTGAGIPSSPRTLSSRHWWPMLREVR